MKLTNFLQAALCGSGILASTLLISPGPNPVTVLLCFGLVNPSGPMGPLRSEMGALIEGRRSRGLVELEAVVVAILSQGVGGFGGSWVCGCAGGAGAG